MGDEVRGRAGWADNQRRGGAYCTDGKNETSTKYGATLAHRKRRAARSHLIAAAVGMKLNAFR